MDEGPDDRMRSLGGVSVDHIRVDGPEHRVMKNRNEDTDSEGCPILVQRDDSHHDEEVEVSDVRATGQVHDRR